MRICLFMIVFFLFLINSIQSQKIAEVQVITSGTNTSLRGMSIASDEIIWVSGSNGTVAKSTDAGKTWRWTVVSGLEKRDLRDIEAFDSSTAIAMAVDNPAVIVKTTDGGATWKKVFERSMPGMFLDAMDFKNKKEGICIGDPVDLKQTKTKHFYIIRTFDGGDSWKEIPLNKMPAAQQGEAIFAASGTNISFLNKPDFEYAFITGGAVSNLHFAGRNQKPDKAVKIPIVQGKETTGAFSMAAGQNNEIYFIGGDYKANEDTFHNYCYSVNNGITFSSASVPPSGYKSCIRIIHNKTLVSCGPAGVDFAPDGQKKWKKISNEGFNVCMVSKGKAVFFAGEKGKIGRLIY